MKKVKRIFSLIFAVIFVVASFNITVFAKDATTGTLANVIVCARFSDDTTDRFATDSDEIIMLYDDTTQLYSSMPYDYSFKAYINEISRGLLNVENTFVQYDGSVLVPFTLSTTLENSTDASILQEIINAFNSGALTLPSGKYDYRTSGIIDNLTVILQCTYEQQSNGVVWPHKSINNVNTAINGKYYVGNYNFLNTYSLLDSITAQGVISHEFLHTVGFPDLYRNGTSGVPVGRWDIMASDSMYQQYPLSYMRNKMGWVPMQTISESGDYVLDPVVDADSDRVVYKIEAPLSSSEFFVVEFRYKNPSYGYYDSKRFDAKLPSTGLLIYRVNTAVEYQTNILGEDYIYVFRPDETGLTDSGGDVSDATINPTDGETSYGSADMSATYADNTIFYSNGQNSGIVISNVSYSEDGSQLSFHVEYPDYSSLDLWENLGSSMQSSCSQTQGVVDSNGKMYVLSTGYINNVFTTDVFTYTDGQWVKAVNSLSNVSDAYLQTFNDELYIIYLNSSGYPMVAKLVNGAWKTIATDKTAQYPNNPYLFKSEDTLYCSWVKDGTDLIIKKVNASSLSAVNSSLTASYFANPCLIAADGYIYVLYSDFFGSNKNAQLRRYKISTGVWESITIPNPISQSNVHRAAYNNGELWFLAAGADETPIVISVKSTGEVTEQTVPTSVTNMLYIGIDVSSSGILYVGLFSSENSSEVLYLQNGEWNKLGSNPCDSIQAVDMFVYGDRVYVPSSTLSSGSLIVRMKEMPQLPTAQLIAKEGTNIEIEDGYVIGVPLNVIDLSLYLDTTENGTFTYTAMGTGAEILLYSADNVLLGRYIIIVRGDVNADGALDGQDSVLINAHVAGMTGFTQTEILACDADGNGVAEAADSSLTAEKGLRLQ